MADIKKKKRKKMVFRIVVIIFIFVYFLIKSVPTMIATNSKTVFAEEETMIEAVEVDGIVVRDEFVFKANASGKVISSFSEGDKLPAGGEVISIDENYQEELNRKKEKEKAQPKQNKTEEVEKTDSEPIGETETINEENFSTEDLQDMIKSGNFEDIHKAKEILKKRKRQEDMEKKEEEVEETKEEKAHEENTSKRAYANTSGLVSFEVDGYEDRYTFDKLDLFKYEDLVIESNREKSDRIVASGDPAYKIINPFEWYLILKVEDFSKVKNLEKGGIARLRIGNDEKEYVGRIMHLDKKDNKATLTIRLTEGLYKYTDKRFVKVDLINKKAEGLKIPNKAIVEKENKKGVYVKDLSGVVRFKEVKILGKDNIHTYVDAGDEKSLVKIEKDVIVKTINIFDEIFLNSGTLKEGQIID